MNFYRETGEKFSTYLNRIRMEEAKHCYFYWETKKEFIRLLSKWVVQMLDILDRHLKNIPDRRRQRIFGSIRIK